MSKMKLCKVCSKEIAKSAKICPYCGAKNKKSKLKIIMIMAVIFIIFISAINSFSSKPSNNNNSDNAKSNSFINVVKTGYLGNYKSVSIETVFDKMFSKCKWNSFESKGKNIVELDVKDSTDTPLTIQFSVEKSNKFSVVFIKSKNRIAKDAYEAKTILDTIYDEYGKKFNSSIVGDPNTSNDTVSGTPNDKYKK